MSDSNIEVLKYETYLKAISNSVGSRIFNSLFVEFKDTGDKKDVMNDGEYSCAFFVSGILYLLQLIEKPVAEVASMKKLLELDEKWSKVDESDIEAGDVIFWDKIKYEDGSENAHVGFALNDKEAVSTDYKVKKVSKHSIDERPITDVYRYNWN